MTPQPKEFERLVGKTTDDFHRWKVQLEAAKTHNLVILLKTGYTSIATPDGKLYLTILATQVWGLAVQEMP